MVRVPTLPSEGTLGVVARNSAEYLRTVLSGLAGGRTVVTLRSEGDTERRQAAGVADVLVPGDLRGWVRDLHYAPQDDGAVAQVLFTSGTEGPPKGILLTHDALANTAARLVSVMSLDDRVREYVGVPVYHSFGFGRCRAVALAGGQVYLPRDGFDPREIVQLLEADEINAISAVPTLWRLVLAMRPPFARVGHRVRWIEIGSQYMAPDEKRALRELFPRASIVQHYGLTEASRTTFLEIHRADDRSLESVGRAAGGAEVSIGPESAIRIRGPHLAAGVLRDGRAEPLVDADSWFTTSDSGHVDAEGYLHFDGRADDVINCGGVKLSPEFLEGRIGALLGPEARVGVCRIPDALRGDAVLVAVPVADRGMDAAAVRAAAGAVLDELGVHGGSSLRLLEVDELPTTDTGKLRRSALRRLYRATDHRDSRHGGKRDAPRDEVERYLLERVSERFGMVTPALNDSILSGGADSLASLELAIDIESEYGVDVALTDLYRAPTIAGIAATVRWLIAGVRPKGYRYVVPLTGGRESSSASPLFIVGGSYGNVMHLHDLAVGLSGVVRPLGIQYRGLLDEDVPRETLAELAQDFLAEVRDVQPRGPYLVGGYSGGGLVAVEMARQLIGAGKTVRAVLMIDTRLPARPPYQRPFTFLDRQRIRLIESGRSGKGAWDVARRASKKLLRMGGVRPTAPEPNEDDVLPPIKLRSERIHRAFVRACASYDVPRLPTRLLYFRPRDEAAYALRGGSIDFVDGHPHRVNGAENGWGSFFENVTVRTVPGGHYTLAHAPNAEHLAAAMVQELRSTGLPADPEPGAT